MRNEEIENVLLKEAKENRMMETNFCALVERNILENPEDREYLEELKLSDLTICGCGNTMDSEQYCSCGVCDECR